MIRMFVNHKVRDYTAWRKVYDEFDPERSRAGVRGHAVYCDVDDPNDVTVWHDFDDLEAARALAGSKELKSAMKRRALSGRLRSGLSGRLPPQSESGGGALVRVLQA